METTMAKTNGSLEDIIGMLGGLRAGIRITQLEIRGIWLFRSLLLRVQDEVLRRDLTAVERVWEMSIMAGIDAGADIEAGRYRVASNHTWCNTDVQDHPLLIHDNWGRESEGNSKGA